MTRQSQSVIRFRLACAEYLLNNDDGTMDRYFLLWKRHYYIQRLCALQIKEFDRGTN